jgi:hypothetical protein
VTPPATITRPAWDKRFKAHVRSALISGQWEIRSPEGIALLQSLLRTSYPYATVVAREQTALDALHGLDPLVVAYRDGLPFGEAETTGRLSRRSDGQFGDAGHGDARSRNGNR